MSQSSDISQVLGFDFSTRSVFRDLKHDLFDEWFFDCLHYQDIFKSVNEFNNELLKYIDHGQGRYPSNKRVVRNFPKKGLPIRYALEVDIYDRFVYQAICSFLAPFFDSCLSHRVLSHRHAVDSRKYLFQNRIENWQTFEGVTRTFKQEGQFLLITDLANYFENIQVNDVIDALNAELVNVQGTPDQKRQIRNALDSLQVFLKNWSFSGDYGLPQNRDPSNFLANFVVCSIDKKMSDLGYDYYRYVDDIRIVCDTEEEAQRSLIVLIECLRTKGLNVNSSKTKILGPSCSEQDLFDCFPARDARIVAIEHMWSSRSRSIILKSIKHLFELLYDCIKQDETQSRQFRFAVNRLAQLSDAGVLTKHQFNDEELQKALVDGLISQPAATDQFCKVLNFLKPSADTCFSIEKFLSDRNLAMHEWQNYHLWILLAKHKVKSNSLRLTALDEITKNMGGAEAAAILIWADQVAYKSVINRAVKCFKDDLPFQTQRYFAIATRHVDRKRMKPLYDRINERIRGTTDRVSNHLDEKGRLILPTREVSVTKLFDEVSEYD